MVLARHNNFSAKATTSKLAKFGQFAVDLFGYPYDKDEIAKIVARISVSHLPFSNQEKKKLKRDR